MKRNFVNEITEIKSRTDFNSRHGILSKFNEIGNLIEHSKSSHGRIKNELLKYIPISIVSCFEVFFRSIIKDLIDSGEPFIGNVTEFNQSKNVKFDFDIVNAIQIKQVTIGDFISHILPLHSFEDINSNLSILIKNDFTKLLRNFNTDGLYEDVSHEFKDKADEILKDIKRTFEIRHIFCHELATNFTIDDIEIARLYDNAKLFIYQSNNLISSLIHPDAPKTQAQMDEYAIKKFNEAEKELSDLIQVVKEWIKADYLTITTEVKFDKIIEAWKKYRKIKAEIDASTFAKGTIYYTIFYDSMLATTEEKIDSLKNEYGHLLKKRFF